MASATERLCALLDERGVEHYDGTESTLWLKDENGYRASADEVDNGMMQLHVWCTTPEQAVAATLGPGTCRAVSMRERDKRPYLHDELVCSKCGCQLAHEFGHVWQHYCPNCGRRVIGGADAD